MNKKNIGFLLAGLMLLPSCMRVPSYKRRSLELFKNNFTYTNTQENITVRAKRLSIPEKDYLFNGRSQVLYAIETLCFSIHNLSQHTYCISPETIGLEHISYKDINAMLTKTNSLSRFSGAAAGGVLTALPFIIVSMETLPTDASAVIILPVFLGMLVVGIPLSLAFLAQGIKSVVMNNRISRDLKEKSLHTQVAIKPGEHYEGIIFVNPSDYLPNFNVTLHQKDNAETNVIFDVELG
jgi:hypothetical protein